MWLRGMSMCSCYKTAQSLQASAAFSPAFSKCVLLSWQCLKRLLSWPGQRVSWGGNGANPSWRCVYQWLQNWVILRSRICRVHWKIPVCPQALDCFKSKTGLSVHAHFCLIFFPFPKRHCQALFCTEAYNCPWWQKSDLLDDETQDNSSSNSLWCSEANFYKMLYMFHCIHYLVI